MGAVWALARNGLRSRAPSLAGLAVVTALGVGGALAAGAVAWRTDHAYRDYLRDAEVGDVVVNPNLLTDRIGEVIAGTPGVRDVVSDDLLQATADDGAPRTRRETSDLPIQIRASDGRRYVARDRPVVHRGRTIAGPGEAFLSLEAADALGLDVGDDVPLAFWTSTIGLPLDLDPDEVVEPLGRTTARVVGVGLFSDEVLPDGLYPRQRVVVSSDVAAPYTCTPEHPVRDDSLTLSDLAPALTPVDCAVGARYFSLRVARGASGVGDALGALARRFEAENERLPQALVGGDSDFGAIPSATAAEAARVRRSIDPSVTAARLLALAILAWTLAVVILGGVRSAQAIDPQVRIWRQLGVRRAERVVAIATPLGIAGAVGLAGAVVVGWVASAFGTVGNARALVPHPDPGLPFPVLVVVVGGAIVALALGYGAVAFAASRGATAPSPVRVSRLTQLAARSGRVPFALGVRAGATGAESTRAGGLALLVGAVASTAAVAGSVVFSANLTDLVEAPARYGWPYDAGAIVGYGYGGGIEDEIATTLDRPEVDRWGLAALYAEARIGGRRVPIVAAQTGFDRLALPLVSGSYPVGDREIALGARSAASAGVAVGDTVTVDTSYGSRRARVTGIVVLPSVGPVLVDRAGLGEGALLPSGFFDAVVSSAERRAGLEPGEILDTVIAFVAIDLRPDADPGAFVRDIRAEAVGWDGYGFTPYLYDEPVRPAQISDVESMRSAPTLLAGLLVVTMSITLASAIALAVRARRHELAVLRSLGCIGAQLRSTVRWQALTVVTIGLVAGLPLGIVAGSALWRAFARGLGIATSPEIPAVWLAILVVGALAVGVGAAALPGRSASRISPATALRTD